MRVPFFDLKNQYALIQHEVDAAIRGVFESGQFIGGNSVRTFERDFAEQLNTPHCIAVGNGTDALFVALKSLGITAGDEVITPAWSWISSSETISLAGAVPVFADADEFFTIDAADVERKITPRTKAIIAVHLYGQMAAVNALQRLCSQHNLVLIEDCAQAHWSSSGGKMAGTFGHLAAFSFYPTKNLGAYGDAGAVVASTDELARRARLFANHGGLKKDDHEVEGFNSRMDPLQASVLSVKLTYLAKWNLERQAHAARYEQLLAGIDGLLLPRVRKDTTHTFHQFVVRTARRDELKLFLAARQIETAIHYPKALPFVPAYKGRLASKSDFPVSASLQNEVLSLPIYPELTNDQIDFVGEQILKFFHG